MVDFFALALTHGLMALAAWRLVMRGDLDREPPAHLPNQPERTRRKSGRRRP